MLQNDARASQKETDMTQTSFSELVNQVLKNSVAHQPQEYATGDYYQTSDENELKVEIPLVGVPRENVRIDVTNGVLNIVGEATAKSRFAKNFKHAFLLTKDANADAVSAKLENGLLTVTVQRQRPVRKVVNVSVN